LLGGLLFRRDYPGQFSDMQHFVAENGWNCWKPEHGYVGCWDMFSSELSLFLERFSGFVKLGCFLETSKKGSFLRLFPVTQGLTLCCRPLVVKRPWVTG
jgi:hypothetical protein